MDGGLAPALVAAAAVAGITGTWSPCGFSMIETIGPTGHTSGRSTTLAACITFTVGALAGGIVTFGAMALAGSLLHGADQRLAYGAAALVALAAAALELRGTRIVPQVRRQLPEHWRRVLPMPIAAALYGGLLGLVSRRSFSPSESSRLRGSASRSASRRSASRSAWRLAPDGPCR